MLAGKLRHRVVLQRPTTTNVAGEPNTTWSNVGTFWAAVSTKGSSEKSADPQVTTVQSHEFTIRYQAGVTTLDRLVFKGRTFQIVGVVNVDELDAYLVLTCLEVA